ncbi:hypothetical protein SISSUDRAFT_84343 [Sistotremastrum suecicum HHB10207 ss-3]|uniref:Uncharacterized protein n=1 Tax=Sistotremastrum suecicum HHB10207 ss-3 TaxID=1314776 RepID=A0A166BCH2_9AGAM|nr:hypothetical protein SISSUDRAFT_84343 [Sistotremastrum suecicum HHB10207 ss-3]
MASWSFRSGRLVKLALPQYSKSLPDFESTMTCSSLISFYSCNPHAASSSATSLTTIHVGFLQKSSNTTCHPHPCLKMSGDELQLPRVPAERAGTKRPGRPKKKKRKPAEPEPVPPSSLPSNDATQLHVPKTPSPQKKPNQKARVEDAPDSDIEESDDDGLPISPTTVRNLRKRAGGVLWVPKLKEPLSEKPVTAPRGPREARNLRKVNRNLNEWSLIKKVRSEDLVFFFEAQKNDYQIKGYALAAEVEQRFIQERGLDLLDPRARRFLLKRHSQASNERWREMTKEKLLVYRCRLECAGKCCAVDDEAGADTKIDPQGGTDAEGEEEDAQESSDGEISEGEGLLDESEGENNSDGQNSGDGSESGQHLHSFKPPKKAKGAQKEEKPPRKRETRETRACKVQLVLEISADDLATVKIWQRHRHGDAVDENDLEYSRHCRAYMADLARNRGATAGGIKTIVQPWMINGYPTGQVIPKWRRPLPKHVDRLVKTVQGQKREAQDAFEGLEQFALQNSDRIFIFSPYRKAKKGVSGSDLRAGITDEWSLDTIILNYLLRGMSIDSKWRGINENWAPLTLIITVDEAGHAAPGGGWITQDVKKDTLVVVLRSYRAKLKTKR